jgi:uncharacterized protein (DUF433 family)
MTAAARNSLPYSERITHEPNKMGGKACIRGIRITASNVMGMLADGETVEEILKAFPYLEPDDIPAVLSYAAWRLQESEQPIPQ